MSYVRSPFVVDPNKLANNEVDEDDDDDDDATNPSLHKEPALFFRGEKLFLSYKVSVFKKTTELSGLSVCNSQSLKRF